MSAACYISEECIGNAERQDHGAKMHMWKVYAHLDNLRLLFEVRMKMVVALARHIGKVSRLPREFKNTRMNK